MELSDLRIFLAVADAGGITRAAQEMHTVQSNVSARLATLERELGAPLFRRHPRGVSLTNAGEQLLPYARRISELTEEARRAIGDDGVPSGPLRVGSLETTAGLRLPAVLSSFTAECPQVDLSLVTGPTESLVEDVLAYRLDGALVTGPVRHPDLVETAMFVEELVLLTARWVVDLDTALLAPGGPRVLVFRAGCSYRARLSRSWPPAAWPGCGCWSTARSKASSAASARASACRCCRAASSNGISPTAGSARTSSPSRSPTQRRSSSVAATPSRRRR